MYLDHNFVYRFIRVPRVLPRGGRGLRRLFVYPLGVWNLDSKLGWKALRSIGRVETVEGFGGSIGFMFFFSRRRVS